MTTQTAPSLAPVAAYLYSKVSFEPHPEQLPILGSRKRFILVAGGEQAGKSLCGAKYLLGRHPETDGPGLFWLVAADYERTRREFDYLVEDFANLRLLKGKPTKRVDPGHIELVDGTMIRTKSAKDPRTLAMEAPDGILICEASQVDLETFNKCRYRVGPKRGWLFLSGTFETSLGWYPGLFSAWQSGIDDRQSFSLPTWTNRSLYPGGRNDPEILAMEREASDDFFMERIAGKPVPPKGLVFPQFRADVHVDTDAEYQKGHPVHLWVDPGYAHAHAVLAVQIIDGQVRVFDEVYERGLITEEIIGIVQQRPWQRDVKFGVIDIGGTQHQAMAAPSEIWLEKMGLTMTFQKVPIQDGIERTKSFLKIDPVSNRPKLIVNPKCKGLLSEMGVVPNPFDGQTRAYRYKMDSEGTVLSDVPEDKNNDACKALAYGLFAEYGPVTVTGMERIRVKRWR